MQPPSGASALPVPDGLASPGHLLRLIRFGAASSRSDLIALTGASRSTIGARVEQLLAAGLLSERGRGASTGGRPPRLLAFDGGSGCVVAVDLGVTSADVALTDLDGRVLGERTAEVLIADGPTAVLGMVDEMARDLLRAAGRAAPSAIGIGVPGPVEFAAGRLVHPPIMPGWHDVVVPEHLAHHGCPVVVDNDVNVMAAGEVDLSRMREDFLVVKVGTGIGCGIVLGGEVYRGSMGSAGDIGHIHVPAEEHVLCSCGNDNCLEAFAGGAALARRAREQGLPVQSAHDLIELALQSDAQALALVRDAGRRIGQVLAALVNFFNPDRIVVCGGVSLAGNALLAGIRESVYRRSLPLAARSLDISISALGDRSGRVGAARMAIERHLGDARVAEIVDAL